MLISQAVQAALTNQPKRKINRTDLWVSDLGRNPYYALKRMLTGEVEAFDLPTLIKMDNGNALEAFTLRQVAENVSRDVMVQVPLFDDIWSGYADLIIGHDSDDDVWIYDHKGSAGKWWDYKGSLPRTADCLQVWMYGQLYQATYGVQPRLGLYYRGWGSWAEFSIEIVPSNRMEWSILATGLVTDEKGETVQDTVRSRLVNPYWVRENIETLYRQVRSGEIVTFEDIAEMEPAGMEWDWAEGFCDSRAAMKARE